MLRQVRRSMNLDELNGEDRTAFYIGEEEYFRGHTFDQAIEHPEYKSQTDLRRYILAAGWTHAKETHERSLANPGEIVSGLWVCEKCGFRLSKNVISISQGKIGVDARLEREECPNDGSLMRQAVLADVDPGPPEAGVCPDAACRCKDPGKSGAGRCNHENRYYSGEYFATNPPRWWWVCPDCFGQSTDTLEEKPGLERLKYYRVLRKMEQLGLGWDALTDEVLGKEGEE